MPELDSVLTLSQRQVGIMKTRPVSTLHVGGDLTVDGNFTIGGNLAVGGTLTVTGATTLTGPLVVNNTGTFMNGINMKETVGGAINGLIAMSGGNMLARTDGTFYWQNRAGSATGATLTAAGALSLTGALGVGGTLNVTGGGGIGGRFIFSGVNASGIATGTPNLGSLEIQPSGGGASMISYHRPGSFAAYMGLDTDNVWKVGGWSMGGAAYRLVLGDSYSNANTVTAGQFNGGSFAGNGTYLATFGGETLFWNGPGGGYRWVNSNNTVQWMSLNTSGNLAVPGTFNAGSTVTGGAYVCNVAGYAFQCISSNNAMYWDNSALTQWSGLGNPPVFRFYSSTSGWYHELRPQTNGFTQLGGNATSLQFPAAGNQLAWTNGSYISGNAGYVQGSQSVLKEHMTHVSDAQCLARVADPGMRVMTYSWPDDNRQSLGFAAEDVHRVLPQSTIKREDQTPTGYVAQELTVVLWGAVRELTKRVQTLEAAA